MLPSGYSSSISIVMRAKVNSMGPHKYKCWADASLAGVLEVAPYLADPSHHSSIWQAVDHAETGILIF